MEEACNFTFSRFLNCTNGTKWRNASHMYIPSVFVWSKSRYVTLFVLIQYSGFSESPAFILYVLGQFMIKKSFKAFLDFQFHT